MQARVNIVNDQPNSAEIDIGRYAMGSTSANLRAWTDSAVELTKKTLQAQGMTLSDQSSKLVKLAVTGAKIDAAGVEFVASLARCRILLRAQTGDGQSRMYEEANTALNPPWACDKAMASVVTALLKDSAILEYLQR